MSGTLTEAFDADRDILLNAPDGKTKLVWYVDFACPHTRLIRDVLLRSAGRFGNPNVSVAIRFFPSEQDHDGGELAARAAIAADAQGKYFEMHRALFAMPLPYSRPLIEEAASDIGLDLDSLKSDMAAEATTERLQQDRKSVTESGGADTPIFFIGNRLYTGTWDEISINEAIEKPLGFRLLLRSHDFFNWAASAGLALVLATIAALIVANIGFHDAYEHLRETLVSITVGSSVFGLSLEAWVNDGLMALFFLIVGIEIKREIIDGELSDLSSAALPIVGAIGGMLMPAALYALVNLGQDTIGGWGVPMATDIAFTLGIMALLGDRVPTSLKVFVSALAIADDLGAILVIAIFYGHGFHLEMFLLACVVMAVMIGLNIGRIYARVPYMVLGVLLWFFIHESGLHATLAGVLTAAAIPSRRSGNIAGVAAQTRAVFETELRRTADQDAAEATVDSAALNRLQTAIERLREPGYHVQHALEKWSNYMILPLFAFFNTGILIFGSSFSPAAPEAMGVIVGLVIGKPLGIFLAAFIAVRLGVAQLSSEISWFQILGAGCLAGVGFTMSIFIGSAAFEGAQLESVKLAILIASTLSAVLGWIILSLSHRKIGPEA